MGKRGFTLIELLGVIVLLAVVSAIAVPSINGITNLIQNNMLEKKLAIIEEAASLYGEDIKGAIMESSSKYKEYPCKSFIVSDLVPDYLSKDNENNCLKKSDTSLVGCIVDPRNDNNFLDKSELIIYYKNKRIYAKVNIDEDNLCN